MKQLFEKTFGYSLDLVKKDLLKTSIISVLILGLLVFIFVYANNLNSV